MPDFEQDKVYTWAARGNLFLGVIVGLVCQIHIGWKITLPIAVLGALICGARAVHEIFFGPMTALASSPQPDKDTK